MVCMVVELQVLVGVAFLEVVLRCVGLSHGSFHRAVVTAEAFTVHIVVVVRSVVRHPKCSIIFFDCLQLLTIFNIIVHIYRVGPRTPVIRPMLSMLVTTVPLPSCCVICVRWSGSLVSYTGRFMSKILWHLRGGLLSCKRRQIEA